MKLGTKQWAAIGIAVVVIIVMAPSDNEGDAASQARPAKQRPAKAASSAPSPDKQRQTTVSVGHVELERLARSGVQADDEIGVGNVFAKTSWYIAPPAPAYVADTTTPTAPPPPPAPTAPPLPFTYMGRYNETGSWIIILAKGERVYTAAEGEVIENTYRLEPLTTGVITLTYLPLNIAQTLRTGDTL